MDDGRSMRAVKGSLGHSSKERYRESEGPRSTRALRGKIERIVHHQTVHMASLQQSELHIERGHDKITSVQVMA